MTWAYFTEANSEYYTIDHTFPSYTALSISCWCNTTEFLADSFLGAGNTPDNGWRIYRSTAGDFNCYFTEAGTYSASFDARSTNASSANTWVHIVGIGQDGQKVKIYVDGTLSESSGTVTSIHNPSAGPFMIGGDQDANQYITGYVQHVAVYGAALTASDVAELSKCSPLLVRPNDLFAYFPMYYNSGGVIDVTGNVPQMTDVNTVGEGEESTPITYPANPILAENTNRRKIGEPASSGPSISYLSGSALDETGTGTPASYTFSSVGLGDAASDRLIVVATYLTNTNETETTCSVGGVSATRIDEISTGSVVLSLFVANVPTGTSGDIVITEGSPGDTPNRFCYHAWRVTGANATPVDTATSSTVSADAMTLNLDIPRQSIVLSVIAAFATTTTELFFDWTTGSGLLLNEDNSIYEPNTLTFACANANGISKTNAEIIIDDPNGDINTANATCIAASFTASDP